MSGWFATGDFWAGFTFGITVGFLFLYFWIIRPMAQLLGFEDDEPSAESRGGTT